MERTGHHTIEGVRSYKRTSDAQRQPLSDILNGVKKSPRMAEPLTKATESPVRAVASATGPENSQQSIIGLLSSPSTKFIGCIFNFNTK